MKIAVIGGGSTYTPELLDGLLRQRERLGLDEVVLEDIRRDRLGPVGRFCGIMAREAGGDVAVRTTEDLGEALDGATFVVSQFRVGGQEARHDDIMMGLENGIIGQETTGVGGFAKALRTIPVAIEIAREMERRCPDAWLINFTNPSGIVTEALLRHGRDRTVGLCNVPIEMHMEIARILGHADEEVELDWVGLNHLGWVRRILIDGNDVLPGIIDRIEDGVAGPANLPEIDYPPGFLGALGMIPSSYVRFFYATDAMLAEIKSSPLTRAQVVLEVERELFAHYSTAKSGALPKALSQRGGAWYSRLAVDVMVALLADTPTCHIVNTANNGAVPDLPDDASVEVPCDVSRAGVTPRPRGEVSDSILGLIRQVKAYERLTIEAAVERSRDKAFLALVNNPLVPTASVARAVLDDLIARGHL